MIWLLLSLSDGGALDYADPALWLRRPDLPAPRPLIVSKQGQATAQVPAQGAGVDCFYVYPTVDLRLKPGQHLDLSEMADPERITRWQADNLGQACTLWVPKYRQATIGSFSGPKGQPALDAAYADVRAAFAHFSQASDRPFVLVGHSQGSVHLSRLIEEEIAGDPALRDRLVVAWLPGSPEPITDSLPPCEDTTGRGCTVAFRSFREGNKVPSFAPNDLGVSCQNPALWTPSEPDAEGWTSLSLSLLPQVAPWRTPDAHPEAELVALEGFEARCTQSRRGDQGLELRWTGPGKSPIPCLHPQSAGNFGTHVLDLAVVQGELVADIQRRAP